MKSFYRSITHAIVLAFVFITLSCSAPPSTSVDPLAWLETSPQKLRDDLALKYGEGVHERLEKGIDQVTSFWREEDGDAAVFEDFVTTNFAGDQETLDVMFGRFEHLFEQLDGHMLEIMLGFREQADLDLGPILPFDEIFAAYSPSAHITDDFFENKLAFTVLLNFPLTTLEQRLNDGKNWSRRQWAETRLAQRFSRRVPAEVNLAIAQANSAADNYISGYNIWMYHLIDNDGNRLFPEGLRLLSHWNLRDELKARYSDPDGGFARQQMIQQVMENIVTQTIPGVVVDNPHVDWNPYTNEVWPAAESDTDEPPPEGLEVTNAPEPDTRYEILLGTFLASRKLDPYSPTAPTLIDRRFDENREIPEERVREMFEQVLSSPLVGKIAKLIESRLGRPLEPFDIWYNGFMQRGAYTEAELDEIVTKRYPDAEAYEKDMPLLLRDLGFSSDRARYISSHIVVDPARGSGHAWGAGMRSAKSHLRTRVGKNGMDYKGFNIAVHEMGHNVEQTISLHNVDHYFLSGVPNTAFTEAVAFVFQARDLELLGLDSSSEEGEALAMLNDFWMTYEIAAVALVDMAIWHWMYDHPEATPAELKDAVVDISKDVWNRFCAPVFGIKDVVLLGVYSHIIHSFLYIPDYPLGHLIAFQIEEKVKSAGTVGSEIERMTRLGNIAPDIWMEAATGSPVGAEALLGATADALDELEK